MIHKFEINKAKIYALARFVAPSNDIRYYLNGVKLEFKDGFLYAVATDGHMLTAFRLEPKKGSVFPADLSVIFPKDLCLAFKKVKGGMPFVPIAYNDENGDIEAHLPPCKIIYRAIEGKYPNWRGVIPKELSGKAGNYNPRYLQALSSMSEYLSGKHAVQISLAQNGDGCAFVSFARYGENFIGAVMPLRDNPSLAAPSWALDPKKD